MSQSQSTQSSDHALRRRLIRHATGIGSEPGINPRGDNNPPEDYAQSSPCLVDVIDYSPENVNFSRFSNTDFLQFLRQPPPKSEEDSPAMLRWINVGGISWDVLSALALHYDIHSLALEDILHEQGHNQSKSDYYHEHLFLRVLCHSLPTEEESRAGPDPRTEYLSYSKRARRHLDDPEKVAGLEGPSDPKKPRHSALSGFYLTSRQQQILRIMTLTKGDRIIVKREPIFIFLLRDGTVLSIHPNQSLDFTEPVMDRMHRHDSVMRTSEDPSMIVEALLDLIVDRILEVMDRYQDKIHELEHDILVKPGMSVVRRLHILSGDLIMHRRSLEPVRSMIYGLRRYDQDRCTALGLGKDLPTNQTQLDGDRHGADAGLGVGVGAHHGKVWGREGYMSYKSKIYLSDVSDHMDFVLASLEMFAGISENLINYAFNMASYEMAEVMRRLTLATIIFLPLTLLTGYFGMNFQSMWSVNNNSDVLFWIIALPLMGVIIPLFIYPDIRKVVHYVQKVMAARRAVIAEEHASRRGWEPGGANPF